MHLYLHIPFCKQACYYCDFHFSTNSSKSDDMVNAICKEIELQKSFLGTNILETIYFGGGTPSLLSFEQIGQILNKIGQHFSIKPNAEITFECNPDDITIQRLTEWRSLGINRLSIGVQSFDENHLKFLNRSHSAAHSIQCISDAQKAGFDNLSIDLIYAIPSLSNDIWKLDLEKAFSFDVNHISSYCLTIEEKTVFGHRLKEKVMKPIDDDFASNQFDILLEAMSKNDFEQYEISNFAKNTAYAVHNTSYWQGDQYLGIGPSAHSFDTNKRFWNVSNNTKYLKAIATETIPNEFEILTAKDKANEYLMTGLRTKWGVDLGKLNKILPLSSKAFRQTLSRFSKEGLIIDQKGIITLSKAGKLKADYIASELFF
ncbi:radical SAM family heme chaperone HemW [Arcticibacterium luteifluviistationis]|uniref:Heme chaperone HemW n=1 Tax=Arcticibacterium luteifluviistationis TaxID=1784714 RepID=A0A2Z4G6Z2_9BACT|nr:radical SAM family heme chaperone HemW [Arcticibacterium luteifluviistationis]AWV96843.1 coproporphyrinogen III oxidase [Arcticibacterium luteifluviistationis]